MRSHSLLSQIADELMTPDFAAKLTEAKFRATEADQRGDLIPLDDIAGLLDLPPAIVEVLLAWNVANTNSRNIVDAMATGREAQQHGVWH